MERYARLVKLGLLVCSLATLGFLISTVRGSPVRNEWRRHQQRYARFLREHASTDLQRDAARGFRIEHKQVFLPQLKRVDRCTTCHLGVDDDLEDT